MDLSQITPVEKVDHATPSAPQKKPKDKNPTSSNLKYVIGFRE